MPLFNILIISCLWLLSFSVFATPSIQLSKYTALGGEKITLTASGGVSPYLWLTEAGELQTLNEKGSKAILTTPQAAGFFSITLRDSQGKRATANFTVIWQGFSVTPEYVYLEPGGSVTFGLHGVIGEVNVIEEAGSLVPLPKTAGVGFRYTAPDKPGFHKITFYQTGNPYDTRSAYVKVFPPFEFVNENKKGGEKEENTVYLEDYENTFLQVKGGVPPYLWIEGGKGKLEPQGRDRDRVRYVPGKIIGTETITVYDRTGNSVNILVTVGRDFQMSTTRHSVCLDNAIVKFVVFGGEPPYTLSPPLQDGWHQIDKTDNKLTLKFTKADSFDVIGSDNAGNRVISSVTVEEFCDEDLKLHPPGPIYLLVRKDGTIPSITVSIEDTTSGEIEWMCIGLCNTDDLNTTEGKIITFIPPAPGHYELSAQDESGRTGTVEVHIGENLFSMYDIDADKKLDTVEMQRALDDFFAPNLCCTRTEFYFLLEHFLKTHR